MRIAILHHCFVSRGGGERVAECLASMFPQADLYTMLASPQGVPASLQGRRLRTSFLQRVPGAAKGSAYVFPLYPLAARSLDLREYDLILSSDGSLGKGARVRDDAIHVCYCHSPMRALYDGHRQHYRAMRQMKRRFFLSTAPRIKRFDLAAAGRVSAFLANSYYVADRIKRLYGRDAAVVYPPVNLKLARLRDPGDSYLCAGSLLPYKRTELMIEACERLGRKLRIAGTGPEEAKLRKLAGPYTTFLGHLSDEQLWEEYARCKALLFAADEDFGLVPVEVQACGRPVLAFGFGGSLETVRAGDPQVLFRPRDPETVEDIRKAPTGIYFSPQTAESLAVSILQFEREPGRFRPESCIAHAAQFSTEMFMRRITYVIDQIVPEALRDMATSEQAMMAIS